MSEVEDFVATACTTDLYELGECCRWDDVQGELNWVDVLSGRFFRARADGERIDIVRSYEVGGTLSSFAPLENRSDGWIVAVNQSILLRTESGDLRELAQPEARKATEVRMNDGVADPWGRFWVGSMAFDSSEGRGSLFRFQESTGTDTILENVTVSNGLGWSPDRRTMYYVDSGPGILYSFDVDERGEISHQRPFLQFDVATEGTPDGLYVDGEGAIWVAMWGGYEVRGYSPDAVQLARVSLSTAQPSCCTIGGVSGTTLYVTTASEDTAQHILDREPDAGRLFSVDVHVMARPIDPYRSTFRQSDFIT
jgi:sugar lactone lactonase YvrE